MSTAMPAAPYRAQGPKVPSTREASTYQSSEAGSTWLLGVISHWIRPSRGRFGINTRKPPMPRVRHKLKACCEEYNSALAMLGCGGGQSLQRSAMAAQVCR